MKWQIVSCDDSVFARRLSRMFGVPVFLKPQGEFDALFFFNMAAKHLEMAHHYRNVPKICYWTGSDARFFLNDPKVDPDFGNACHATDTWWLVAPLSKKIHVPCFTPLPPYLPNFNIGVESPPGLLIYLTIHPARDIERMRAVIKELSDVPIYIIRGKGKKVADNEFQKNVVSFDWIEDDKRERIFRKVSTHVRLMNYDGLSQTVVEMKMLGRHVLYTEAAPYCDLILKTDSPKNIAERVRHKINASLDEQGAKWYQKTFSRKNFLEIIKGICVNKKWDFPYEIIAI